MCYDYEFEYLARRAQQDKEQARKEVKKPQPVEPQEAAREKPEEKPVPA